MINLNHETVSDIVAEMRQDIADGSVCMWADFGGEIARGYVNRIEAASAREREAGADAAQICGEIGEIVGMESAIAELKRENERLLSALKPVLDAYISQDDHSVDVYDSRLDAAVCVRAVRDAKRIYG